VIGYSVEVDQDQVATARSLFEFIGGNSADALRVAINKTAPKIKTLSSSEIRTQVRLSASYVGDKITITKATKQKLEGRIKTASRGLLLSKFSTDTQVAGEKVSWLLPPPMPPRGIKVKVKPSGTTKSPGPTTFYMVLPISRALAIVKRKTTPGPRGGNIDVLYGPSISQVFSDVRQDVLPAAGKELTAQLLDAMRYLLVKQYPVE
jgi:hypothetical protein